MDTQNAVMEKLEGSQIQGLKRQKAESGPPLVRQQERAHRLDVKHRIPVLED